MSAVLIIAKLNFKDRALYDRYRDAFPAVFAGSGGAVLAADEEPVTLGGDVADKIVVMRFPSAEQAQAFLNSPDYQRISQDRDAGAITHSWMAKAF